MTDPGSDCTTDGFLGGLVTLVQPRKGHRAGLDAALLQAVVPPDAAGLAVDLGTGTGAIAFAAAARAPRIQCIGIDRDAAQLDLAAVALRHPDNAAFAGRIRLVQAEIGNQPLSAGDGDLPWGRADWVLMNPPYDQPGRVRASPDPGKRQAYVGDPLTVERWINVAVELLRPGGQIALIHRPAALSRILAGLQRGFGDVRIVPIHPHRQKIAGRVLVVARSESSAPLRLLPGLILHEARGGWTAEADAILRGAAVLPI